jgi:acyl-[acyl-carrier-protein]-phospholipid O-acyltransferase/long-chain-fatty-acid--[acyl-carrier-protein] ligase
LVVAGAEKLRDETRRAWQEKFGLRILEGYGVTEAAPVIAFNTPLYNKSGTVGRILPGIQWRLEKVDGIDEGGRLCVAGPNIMAGYLLADAPGELKPPSGGWHDTGDIARIDGEGYLHIVGRAKRFAKVSGEMVSLAAVEEAASALWPENQHAAVAATDARRGEIIMLLTDRKDAAREELLSHYQKTGMPEIAMPRRIIAVAQIPLLATGKPDYRTAAELAKRG